MSRQNISQTIKNVKKTASENIENFREYYSSRSLVIGHWSSHGCSFLDVIARTFKDFHLTEKLIHFDIAK